MMTRLPRGATTPRKVTRMVMCQSWDTPAPGSQYSRGCRNDIPHGKCGLMATRLIRKEDCQKTRQLVTVCTLVDSTDVQA